MKHQFLLTFFPNGTPVSITSSDPHQKSLTLFGRIMEACHCGNDTPLAQDRPSRINAIQAIRKYRNDKTKPSLHWLAIFIATIEEVSVSDEGKKLFRTKNSCFEMLEELLDKGLFDPDLMNGFFTLLLKKMTPSEEITNQNKDAA